MEDTEKYLIHATVTAEGIVERSDVVGAIFGQTEGLLGDELDLPELRRTGKLGRIDVSVSSTGGESRGEITMATSLDKVETATLAAALETIDRVGPCRAALTIDEIEDVRAAKRRAVVDRATELLRTGFDDSVMSSEEILTAVREHVRVADITEVEGLPAGPRVAEGDAIIVVEGRSDVLTLLRYGIKNAIGVEGTNVPDEIAELSRNRTVTAFFDADRGGELILEELCQIGEVDYVARPPAGSSVEDLGHHEVFTALRDKEPVGPDAPAAPSSAADPSERVETMSTSEDDQPTRPASSTDGGSTTVDHADGGTVTPMEGSEAVTAPEDHDAGERPVPDSRTDSTGTASAVGVGPPTSTEREEPATTGSATGETEPSIGDDGTPASDGETASASADVAESTSLYEHVASVVTAGSGRVRFLDDDRTVIGEYPVNDAGDALESADRTPSVVILDGILTQELLDRAADRGVSMVVADATGQFVKRPASVRVYEASAIANAAPDEN